MNRKPVAEAEIQRILALVPYLVAHPDSFKADVAERFGVTVAQLDRDLEHVLMVGVPPYTPGDYIDVDDDGDFVTLRMADSFRRPLRLTPSEGLSVLAAGRTLLAVPGADNDGPLVSALNKLAAALDFPDVDVVLQEPSFLAELRVAVDAREQEELAYWTASRNELTLRTIDPLAAFFAEGAWYLDAFCHVANDDRLFRVDRVRGVKRLGTTFQSDDDRVLRDTQGALYEPRSTDPTVVIEVEPSDRWVADHYPVSAVEDMPGGQVRISMTVSEPTFLQRILVQLGATARVASVAGSVTTDEYEATALARRMLGRYEKIIPLD